MAALKTPRLNDRRNRAYQILGRSLEVVARFESDCRVLLFALKVQDPTLENLSVEDFADVITKAVLAQLNRAHTGIASGTGMSEEQRDALKSAREARNYIAHHAAERLDEVLSDSERLSAWLGEIQEAIHDLAAGISQIAVLLPQFCTAPTPGPEQIASFPERLSAFVVRGESVD